MRNAFVIPLGAGLLSAALYLTIALGSPSAFLLAYFAQAPIAAAGFSLGFMPAAGAAAFASIFVLVASPSVGALSLYLLTSALPIMTIVFFALQNRENKNGNLEWYPIKNLLTCLTVLGIAAFFLVFMLFLFFDDGMIGIGQRYFQAMFPKLDHIGQNHVNEVISLISQIFPALAVTSWILMNILNCVLAQKIVVMTGKNIRPTPSFSATGAVIWPLSTAIIGIILSSFGGQIGFLGINLFLISLIPFFFIGLAVLHSVSVSWPGRLLILTMVYILMAITHWPAAILAAIGVLEYWFKFRNRSTSEKTDKENE